MDPDTEDPRINVDKTSSVFNKDRCLIDINLQGFAIWEWNSMYVDQLLNV